LFPFIWDLRRFVLFRWDMDGSSQAPQLQLSRIIFIYKDGWKKTPVFRPGMNSTIRAIHQSTV